MPDSAVASPLYCHAGESAIALLLGIRALSLPSETIQLAIDRNLRVLSRSPLPPQLSLRVLSATTLQVLSILPVLLERQRWACRQIQQELDRIGSFPKDEAHRIQRMVLPLITKGDRAALLFVRDDLELGTLAA